MRLSHPTLGPARSARWGCPGRPAWPRLVSAEEPCHQQPWHQWLLLHPRPGERPETQATGPARRKSRGWSLLSVRDVYKTFSAMAPRAFYSKSSSGTASGSTCFGTVQPTYLHFVRDGSRRGPGAALPGKKPETHQHAA